MEINKKIYLFGGESAGTSTMVLVNGKPYLFGGGTTGERAVVLNDLWYLEGSSEWKQINPNNTPPKARKNHSAVAYGEKMFVFFGVGDQGYPLGDIWAYDVASNQWQEVITNGNIQPGPRGDHSVVAAYGHFYMFGGKDRYNNVYSDLWSCDLGTYTWNQEPSYTMPSQGHRTVANDTTMYVYGGDNGQLVNGNLLSYDFATKQWKNISPQSSIPAGRTCHIATLDANKIRISGGRGQTEELGDTWEYDIVSNQWVRKADGPVQSRSAAVVLPKTSTEAREATEEESNVFMFVGQRNGQFLNESWIYYPNESPCDTVKDLAVSPNTLKLKKKESETVTVTATGKNNCPVEGVTVTATVNKSGSKRISVSPSSSVTDENGETTFTITAKDSAGRAVVKFKTGDIKVKGKVTVR